MALGATAEDVRRQTVSDTLLLYATSATDPLTFAAMVAVLASVGSSPDISPRDVPHASTPCARSARNEDAIRNEDQVFAMRMAAEWKYPHASHFENVRGGESVFATTRTRSLPHLGQAGVFVIFSGTPRELQDQFPARNAAAGGGVIAQGDIVVSFRSTGGLKLKPPAFHF